MKITLTAEHEELIRKKVASGEYSSPQDVIRRALRLLQHQDQLAEMELADLRREIDVGLKDLRAGRSRTYQSGQLKQLAEEIKSSGRRRLAAKRRKRA